MLLVKFVISKEKSTILHGIEFTHHKFSVYTVRIFVFLVTKNVILTLDVFSYFFFLQWFYFHVFLACFTLICCNFWIEFCSFINFFSLLLFFYSFCCLFLLLIYLIFIVIPLRLLLLLKRYTYARRKITFSSSFAFFIFFRLRFLRNFVSFDSSLCSALNARFAFCFLLTNAGEILQKKISHKSTHTTVFDDFHRNSDYVSDGGKQLRPEIIRNRWRSHTSKPEHWRCSVFVCVWFACSGVCALYLSAFAIRLIFFLHFTHTI